MFRRMADPNSLQDKKNPYNVRIANGLMKGRVFNLNQNDPSMTPQWMFQPYTGTGSVDEMIQLWEDGLNDAFEYQTVMIVNEETGVPEVDANTGDIIEMEVKVPSAEYIRDKLGVVITIEANGNSKSFLLCPLHRKVIMWRTQETV